jgi:hypothetical protein
MYPENTTSNFTVYLPKQMTFDEYSAVGLYEIHFPLGFESKVKEQSQKNEDKKVDEKNKNEYVIITEDGENARYKRELVMSEQECVKSKKQKRSAVVEENSTLSGMDEEPYRTSLGATKVIPPECRKTADEYEHMMDMNDHQWEKAVIHKKGKLDLCKAEKEAEIDKTEIRLQELLARHDIALTQLKKEMDEKNKQLEKEVNEKNKELENQRTVVHYWKDNFVSLAHLAYRDANQMNNAQIPKYLYVYCDIVQMRQVGNTYANFLHIARVPPIRINGDTAVERFDFPRYTRLSRQSFDSIKVMIRDEKGRLVQFKKPGVVIITLHFKSIR